MSDKTQEAPVIALVDKTIAELAVVISDDWKEVWFGAVPYLTAMMQIQHIGDMYFNDSGVDIVARFLVNAGKWKGNVARQVKAELRARLKKETGR